MTKKNAATKHLDLGCGLAPRNPYQHAEVFGCDIRDIDEAVEKIGFGYKRVNLITEPIPFPDHFFNSISAFDFLEHVPRQLILPTGEARNPFVELMNEIHRVLVPGGILLALTPAYPHPAAFTDPTHVNIITDETHHYFSGDAPGAAIYGFKGKFEVVRAERDTPGSVYEREQSSLKQSIRRIHRRWMRGGLSHMVWELKAV